MRSPFSVTGMICFSISLLPLGLMSLMGLGVPPSEMLTPYWATTGGFAALGMVFASLGRFRAHEKVALLVLLMLCFPLLIGGLGLRESLEARAWSDARTFCALARREGVAPIPRTDARYKARLDADGDGLACELPAVD
jgi:hypothetical protein